MKRSDFILIGVILLIVGLALFSSKGNVELEDVEYPLALVGDAGLHQLTYNEYESKLNSDEPFIVVIERASCGYCSMYMPIVEEVAKEKKIPLYYVDTDTFTAEEFEKLNNSNSYLKRNQWGTPTTLFMLGNRVLTYIDSYVEKESLVAFLDGKVVMGD